MNECDHIHLSVTDLVQQLHLKFGSEMVHAKFGKAVSIFSKLETGLASSKALYARLLRDSRMKDAYALLVKEFTSDESWAAFICAASAADEDFEEYRAKMKRALDIKQEVAETAARLSVLMDELMDNRCFHRTNFDTRELLLKTRWHHLSSDDLPNAAAKKIPPMPVLLSTLSEVADDFIPTVPPDILAAISSRQSSTKTECLRAFGCRLVAAQIRTTAPMMRAMAIVANVIINDPEADVTYDDVRKALARLPTSGKPETNKDASIPE